MGSHGRRDLRLNHDTIPELCAAIICKNGIHQIVNIEGVSLNGEALRGKKTLALEDEVTVGMVRLLYQGSHFLAMMPPKRGIGVSVRNLTKKKRNGGILLDNVSLEISPGEMVAIIGGSGTGKTTLLNAMSGYDRIPEGKIFYDGVDLHKNLKLLRRSIGYVPQEDIVHKDLKLKEMLLYSARLRMPPGCSQAEREKRVGEAIAIVQLAGEKEDQLISKMSGGQRKRASIAVELLAQPALLFLDEPASGLDQNTEEELLNSLREIAKQGTTIILVTHSPSFLGLYDKTIVMGHAGRLCYYDYSGDSNIPSSNINAYFGIEKIGKVYGLLDEENEGEAERWRQKYDAMQAMAPPKPIALSAAKRRTPPPASFITHLRTLTARYMKVTFNRYRNAKIKGGRFWAMPIVFGLILGLIIGEDYLVEFGETQVVSFIMACLGMWIGLFLGIPEVSGERAILKREVKANLNTGAYILSKVGVLSFVAILQTALLFVVFFLICLARGKTMPTQHASVFMPWIENWITVGLVCLSSITLGLLISSCVKKPEGIAPYILMAQIILPGVLLALPGLLDMFKVVSSTYWGNRALCASADINELGWVSAYNRFGDFASEVFTREDAYIHTWENLRAAWAYMGAIFAVPILFSGLQLRRLAREDDRGEEGDLAMWKKISLGIVALGIAVWLLVSGVANAASWPTVRPVQAPEPTPMQTLESASEPVSRQISALPSGFIINQPRNERHDVYTGPGTHYHRVMVNKTRVFVSTNGWIKAYARDGDWLLIEYETSSSNGNRMGYVRGSKISNFRDAPELPKANLAVRFTRLSVITDDPNVGARVLLDIPEGARGTLLCLHGDEWGYIEIEINNVLMRGFVIQGAYELE